mmetsp:Transcript_8341/g.8315  ORF Transcript_8341/g.8315 Transcript_8341/m.8315 type:complete len:190 (+) Transcript_8341:383-952(+)
MKRKYNEILSEEILLDAKDIDMSGMDVDIEVKVIPITSTSLSKIDNIKPERKRDSLSNVFSSISRLFIPKSKKYENENTDSSNMTPDNKTDNQQADVDIKHINKKNTNSESISASKPLLFGSVKSGSKSDLSDFSTFKNNGLGVEEVQGEDITLLKDENAKLKTRIIYLENEMIKINDVLSEIENLVKF